MKKKVIAIVGLLALLALPGCSSGGGPSQEQLIELDVEALLGFLGAALPFLDPFGAPVTASAGLGGGGGCQQVALPAPLVCEQGTGPIERCPQGANFDVDFQGCLIVNPQDPTYSVQVDGIVTYSPPDKGEDPNWPAGVRVVEAETTNEHWIYTIGLNGTANVTVSATDLNDGTMANCTGNLVSEQADCVLVKQPG